MAPILKVVLAMPESLKPKTELSPASNVFRHVVEWVRLVLLTEYDNVMDICRMVLPLTAYCIFRTLDQDVSQSPQELEVWPVYHLYRLKTKSSVSLRDDIVSF